jgi:hypothetical protein
VNLFSKCPVKYTPSQMAVVSNVGIFNFLQSLDPDVNKTKFKDSYIGGYFHYENECPGPGASGCTVSTTCSVWNRCTIDWKWIGGTKMATSASSGSWCVGSKNGYYNENSNDICVRIHATNGTCFTNKACTDDKNFICEYSL